MAKGSDLQNTCEHDWHAHKTKRIDFIQKYLGVSCHVFKIETSPKKEGK